MKDFLHILPAIIIFAIAGITVLYWIVQEFKKKKVQKDLIYLEFLIQHGEKNHITSKNIKTMILDYNSKREYHGKYLNRCEKLFNEKFS